MIKIRSINQSHMKAGVETFQNTNMSKELNLVRI